jgi:hypothetical protein
MDKGCELKTEPRTSCPACGNKGRRVSPVTPASLLRPSAAARLDASPLRFCGSAECEVVYFDEAHAITFVADDLTVAVFQKASDPARLVCYCFDVSVASIEDDVRRSGDSDAPTAIAAKCKAGLDTCERTNPQGSCCLGNVREVVKRAQGEPQAEGNGEGCCCGGGRCDS